MANFNKVILLGNLTRDPVLKYLPSGVPVCELGLAVNRSWTDNTSGEKREAVAFIDCRAMGKQAEILNQYLKKGRPVMIEGRLEYRAWEKDGQKRNKLDVFIESFQFVGGRGQDGEAGEGGERPAASSRPARVAEGGYRADAARSPEPRTSTPSFEGTEGNVVDDEVPF